MRLRCRGYRQLKCDVCMFAIYDSSGLLTAVLVCHVDDILFTGADAELSTAEELMCTSRACEIEKSTPQSPIIPTGVLLEGARMSPRNMPPSKSHYDAELRKVGPSAFVANGGILRPSNLRSTTRQVLGALIMLRQPRPDIGFDITEIPADALAACQDATMALETLSLYNNAARYVQNYDRKLLYMSLPQSPESLHRRPDKMGGLRRIVVPNSCINPLSYSLSIEGSVAVLAQLVSRDGVILCRGALVGR